MSVKEKLNDIKKKLAAMKKKSDYKKANKERAKQAQLTVDLANCAGDLGICKKEYEWSVRDLSRLIQQGIMNGNNVEFQKEQLIDAAVGYILVDEAMYVLQSVGTYDSLTRAYDLLDAATMSITGEKAIKFPSFSGGKPKRKEFDYLNSSDLIEEKKGFVSEFLDDLIESGDIQATITEARKKKNERPSMGSNAQEMPDPSYGTPGASSWQSRDELLKKQLINDAILGNTSYKPGPKS